MITVADPAANQPLRDDAENGAGDLVRLQPHLDEPRDSASRISGVQRADQPVA